MLIAPSDKKKKGIAQLRARYTNQTILRRNDNLPSPGLEPGSPGRTRTILVNKEQIMSIYRGEFPSCDSGGGAGPSARNRGATWRAPRPSAPDPLDVCARTPRASRIPPPPSDRPCQSLSGRGRLWDPTTTLGFAGTPNDRTLLGTEWPSVEGEEEEKKKNECKQRGQRERGALARAIAREEGIVTRSPWRTGTTTRTPSSSPSPASSAPSSSL